MLRPPPTTHHQPSRPLIKLDCAPLLTSSAWISTTAPKHHRVFPSARSDPPLLFAFFITVVVPCCVYLCGYHRRRQREALDATATVAPTMRFHTSSIRIRTYNNNTESEVAKYTRKREVRLQMVEKCLVETKVTSRRGTMETFLDSSTSSSSKSTDVDCMNADSVLFNEWKWR
jgi:hypothetical protein